MRFAILLVAALLLLSPARAADEAGTARAVIESQFDAFGRDDADGAYALAAPAIRNIFTDAATFMEMVRGPYAPVYRHKRHDFGETSVNADAIVQHVGLVDSDDVAWEAIYTLEKQADGTWKISGCVLKKVGTAV
jgi:hypothetical protein